MMNQHYLLSTLILILIGCTAKVDTLISENWILKEGQYLGEEINFQATDIVQIVDQNGNVIRSINFSKNGSIFLPGINSASICARWNLLNNQLKFEIDSSYYNSFYNFKKDFTHEEIGKLTDSDEISLDTMGLKKRKIFIRSNPILTNAFQETMKVYENPFDFEIKKNLLILTSETTKIIAFMDRSGYELLNRK